MSSASLAMIAPPFFPSPTTATTTTGTGTAADPFQFQFQLQPQLQCLPRLQELKGFLPLHFHAQPTQFSPQYPNSDPFSLSIGITEQCSRHSCILSYLTTSPSASASAMAVGSNIQTMPVSIDALMQMPPEQAEQLVQFLGTLSPGSLLTVDPSGRILFSGNPSEMRELLSILTEFNSPPAIHQQHRHASSNVSLLVPYFDRSRGRAKAASRVALLDCPIETVVPLKSNGTNKTRSSHKKRQKKTTNYNRDIFQKNYFHACESLLTLLLYKSSTSTGTASTARGTGATILSLKKMGPEIAQILTSFSIGIAGTGLAVLFSVACRATCPCTRLPISATRVFNTGFGLGLFWLSCAVNGLRDTIIQVFRESNKVKMRNEETTALKVERSMRDVLFRAGTLVALAALRFA